MRFHLSQNNDTFSNHYAKQSLEIDPARRLGVSVEGVDRRGSPFSIWLQSDGDKIGF